MSSDPSNVGDYFIQGAAVQCHAAAPLIREAIARRVLVLEANPHNLDPDRPATRAELLTMLYRTLFPEAAISESIARHLVVEDDLFDEGERWTSEAQLADSYDFMIEQFFGRGRFGTLPSSIPNGRGGPVFLNYVAYETPNLQSERSALVVVNGRTESAIKFAEFIYDVLAQTDETGRRFSLYIYDHRGQGFSDRLLGNNDPSDVEDFHRHHVANFRDYVFDLNTFVRQVVMNRLHDHVFALGHSMGGGITTLYAQRYPNDFDAVVLSAPMHEVLLEGLLGALNRGVIESMRVRMGRRICRPGCLNNFDYNPNSSYAEGYAPHQGPWDPQDPESQFVVNGELNPLTHSQTRFDFVRHIWLRFPSIQLGGISRNWLVQSLDATGQLLDGWNPDWNMWTNAEAFTAPLLLIRAGGDRIVGRAGQEQICRRMNTDGIRNCRIVVSEDPGSGIASSHEAIFEIDPIRDQFLDRTLEFFSSCETGRCALFPSAKRRRPPRNRP